MKKKAAIKTDNPIRILQVTGGMNAGGAETMLMHLYRKIDRSKVQFDFISFTQERCHYDEEIRDLGGRIFFVPPPKSSNFLSFLIDIYHVIKQNEHYHAIHAHTLFNSGLVLLAARFAGIKLRVCHSHNTLGDYGDVLGRKIYFGIMRVLIKCNANRNVACSKAAARFLFGKEVMVGQKFHLLYNAIDLFPYRVIHEEEIKSMRKELGIQEDTLIIGHVGKFGEQKNHAFLIELAEFLKNEKVNFRLLLIGSGTLKEKIESLVKQKELGEYVKFLGVQTNIPLFMNMFDVFVFPSLYEGLGIVLIEAQAAGTPCVISDSIPEECDMGLGLISRLNLKDTPESWYEAILSSCRIIRKSSEITTEAILKNGYNLDATVGTLMSIYGLVCP